MARPRLLLAGIAALACGLAIAIVATGVRGRAMSGLQRNARALQPQPDVTYYYLSPRVEKAQQSGKRAERMQALDAAEGEDTMRQLASCSVDDIKALYADVQGTCVLLRPALALCWIGVTCTVRGCRLQ